jgi:guanylate kinase
MLNKQIFPFGFINITAPTSAGKTTLIKAFRGRFPSSIDFSKSCTTRDLTEKEIEEGLYESVSVAEFLLRIQENLFLEWNKLKSNDQYYGTLLSEYYRIKNAGKIVIGDLDNNGARDAKKILGDDIYNVYLMLTEGELRRRMFLPESRVRDNPEKRLAYAVEENKFATENKGTIFDLILPYDHRSPSEAITQIISQMRKKAARLLAQNS